MHYLGNSVHFLLCAKKYITFIIPIYATMLIRKRAIIILGSIYALAKHCSLTLPFSSVNRILSPVLTAKHGLSSNE